jgi:hypothetical protein
LNWDHPGWKSPLFPELNDLYLSQLFRRKRQFPGSVSIELESDPGLTQGEMLNGERGRPELDPGGAGWGVVAPKDDCTFRITPQGHRLGDSSPKIGPDGIISKALIDSLDQGICCSEVQGSCQTVDSVHNLQDFPFRGQIIPEEQPSGDRDSPDRQSSEAAKEHVPPGEKAMVQTCRGAYSIFPLVSAGLEEGGGCGDRRPQHQEDQGKGEGPARKREVLAENVHDLETNPGADKVDAQDSQHRTCPLRGRHA